jgi:hypothetical protein
MYPLSNRDSHFKIKRKGKHKVTIAKLDETMATKQTTW